MALAILAHGGVHIGAGTGQEDAHDWRHQLGAAEAIPSSELEEGVNKPLLRQRGAGGIDSVAGDILFNALKSLEYGGTAVCFGLAGSPELHGTVFPFILRNVNLIGVDSVEIPVEFKQPMWQLLADDWRPQCLDKLCSAEAGLPVLPHYFQQILAGQVHGRVLVSTS